MQKKPVIQLLSDQVINKIAAGEVVERPASVIKELFENALDAGASQIDVEVIQGGRQLMAITDNGCGMNRDQALLAIERHATSKIRSEADIENISTLGFRGEALAAISSVSRFTLISRPEEQLAGTEIQISGGNLQSVEEIGAPEGTRFEIRNLFFNVPARRKFLRAEQTELSHIRQLFLVQALAHPNIGMSLKVDERMVYKLPASGKMEDRITELYNTGFFEQLLPINYQDEAYTISGYAGLPQTGRKDRQDQYIFINNRPASAPVVYHAITEAYHALISKGRFPAIFLFVEMAPSLVDVNVHPQKKEVRFRRPTQLRDAITKALTDALTFKAVDSLQDDESIEEEEESTILPTPASETATPTNAIPAPPPPAAVRPKLETQGEMDDLLIRPAVVESIIKKKTEPPKEALEPAGLKASPPEPDPTPTSPTEKPATPEAPQSPWGWCQVIGQIGGNYIILETEDGFVLMEPRAAHERVLFEKFMNAAHAHQVPQQGLLAPETIDLLPSDAQIVRESLKPLHELGFGISEFGGDTFIVDALPVYVQDGPVETLLTDIARELERAGKKRSAHSLIQEMIAQVACQTAVRNKDQLSDREIERLVADLAQTDMPYTSPRGRPTLIYTSFTELNRKFSKE